jgi:hypothetical protein
MRGGESRDATADDDYMQRHGLVLCRLMQLPVAGNCSYSLIAPRAGRLRVPRRPSK